MGLQFGSTNLADIDTTDGLGLHVDPTQTFPIDRAEAAAAEPYNPNPSNGAAWWENVISYGAGRWIDNGFTTAPRIGNYDTGSGAGNSGRTYTNRAGNGGAAPVESGVSGVSPLLLIGGAVLLGFVLLRG